MSLGTSGLAMTIPCLASCRKCIESLTGIRVISDIGASLRKGAYWVVSMLLEGQAALAA